MPCIIEYAVILSAGIQTFFQHSLPRCSSIFSGGTCSTPRSVISFSQGLSRCLTCTVVLQEESGLRWIWVSRNKFVFQKKKTRVYKVLLCSCKSKPVHWICSLTKSGNMESIFPGINPSRAFFFFFPITKWKYTLGSCFIREFISFLRTVLDFKYFDIFT